MQTYCSLFLPNVVLCYYELKNGKLFVKLGIVIAGSLARLHLHQHRLLFQPPLLKLVKMQLLGCSRQHRRRPQQPKEAPINEFCSCSWASNSDARWPNAHTSLTHEELSLTKFVRCVLRLLTICIFWHRLAISRITVVTDYLGFSVGLVYDFFSFNLCWCGSSCVHSCGWIPCGSLQMISPVRGLSDFRISRDSKFRTIE